MAEFPECEGLGGRLRQICRGESGLSRRKENETRRLLWGLQPLPYTATPIIAQRTDQPTRSRGLGDTIAKITHATGIDKAVKAVTGGGCGCAKRQQMLNEIFPYKGAQ